MKFLLIPLLWLWAFQLSAQDCNTTEHSSNLQDSWLSCSTNTNPNPDHPNTHWILYDLGYTYAIGGTYFWNYNENGFTEAGMRNVIIDYSLDGKTWVQAANFQLPEANGSSDYLGSDGPNLGGVQARYILVTATDNWGAACTGLSEIRLDLETISMANEVARPAMKFDIYPNPATNSIRFYSEQELKELIIINSNGQELQRLPFQSIIDVSQLPSGIYYVKGVSQNNELLSQKIVKQ